MGLCLCLGTLLGAGAAIAHFFQPELQTWAQGPTVAGKQPAKKGASCRSRSRSLQPITELDARNARRRRASRSSRPRERPTSSSC